MGAENKAIGIFGGTFDPVHNGHVSIAHSFLDSGYIDELWVLLSPYPPHKEENGLADYDQRLRMLKAVFAPIAKTKVSDLERTLPEPSYSVQTLQHLTRHYPDYHFYFCLGKDSFYTFTTWHQWEELLDYCTLLVADRPTDRSGTLPEKLINRMHFIDHDAIAISSTEIRRKVQKGEDVSDMVPGPVMDIIKENKLYMHD